MTDIIERLRIESRREPHESMTDRYESIRATPSQAQQPSTQAWANETGLRQIECPSCGSNQPEREEQR